MQDFAALPRNPLSEARFFALIVLGCGLRLAIYRGSDPATRDATPSAFFGSRFIGVGYITLALAAAAILIVIMRAHKNSARSMIWNVALLILLVASLLYVGFTEFFG